MSEKSTTQYDHSVDPALDDRPLRTALEIALEKMEIDQKNTLESSDEHLVGSDQESLPSSQSPLSADRDDVLRRIRTKIASMPESSLPSLMTDIERAEEADRITEIEGQKQFEANQRLKSLTDSLSGRGYDWYLDLLTAAKEIYPEKTLPDSHLWVFFGGNEKYPLEYALDYDIKKKRGQRDYTEVNSLSIRSKYSFGVDFNCENGKVDEIALQLPKPASWIYGPASRANMAESLGGSLGAIIRNVYPNRAKRLRFVFGDGAENPPAIIAEDSGFLERYPRKNVHPYDSRTDSFCAADPRHDLFSLGPGTSYERYRDEIITADMFVGAIDQLYGLIPGEEIKI